MPPSEKALHVERAMQFSLVSDPPGTSLQDRALQARNELVTKLLGHWQRLAEVQLLYYEPGGTSAFQRLPQSLNCMVEDHDRYVPNIEDEGIDGDEKLYLQYLEETRQSRAAVAKKLADEVIRACQDAYEALPRARTFEARVMLFDKDGSIETGPSQKFPASSLGQLQTSDEPDDDDLGRSGGPLDELVRTIKQLVSHNANAADQMRIEKADIHQRYIELTDKNMSMLDKFKDLTEMALTHSTLPPEHYELEATKLQMRNESHRAAMIANTKAAMAHERQQTVQAFIRENPNFLQDLLATVATLYQQHTGAPPTDVPPYTSHVGDAGEAPSEHERHDEDEGEGEGEGEGVHDTSATPDATQSPPSAPPHNTREASGTRNTSKTRNAARANKPSLCRGARKLHALLNTSTIAAMERSLAPDHWRALSPLLSCTDEAEFRHHINALTEALSQLPRGSLIRFQMGLLKSIPLDVRKPLTELLGSYGLRIH